MGKPYYQLLTRPRNGKWEVEFGAYDRADVVAEQGDWADHYDDDNKKRRKSDTRIVKFDHLASQDELAAFIADLNTSA